jgi:mannose-6-phosphate isomerase-like protein (cupin superfamily)
MTQITSKVNRPSTIGKYLSRVLLPAALLTPALAQSYQDHVNLYFGDWHNAPVQTAYGHLAVQDILTSGDALHPSSRGTVLRSASAYRHASLPPHSSTSKVRLEGRQQVYFVESGAGTATTASQKIPLSSHVAVLVPANLEFTFENTGDQPLSMYLMEEPTPPGFHPNSSILARDENALPFSATDQDWSYMVKKIFTASDGLATLTDVSTVTLDPLTIGRPRVTESQDVEAVWTMLKGSGIAFISNQLIRQSPGATFLEVPDGKTPHSTINPNEDSQVTLLYFAHKPAPIVHPKPTH